MDISFDLNAPGKFLTQCPSHSPYFWMYQCGCKGIELDKVIAEAQRAGHVLRNKDVQNYWNGVGKSTTYSSNTNLPNQLPQNKLRPLEEYPLLPNQPRPTNIWVPCNADNKPMIKWGQGCMEYNDAKALAGQKYLGINNRGLDRIVIDIDGDHDKNNLDWEIIEFGNKFIGYTKTMSRPNYRALNPCNNLVRIPGFHIIFKTNRVIPVMHYRHLDIIGNEVNTLQYLKTKQADNVETAELTPDVWRVIIDFIERRKEDEKRDRS